jgi:hypothetical protein
MLSVCHEAIPGAQAGETVCRARAQGTLDVQENEMRDLLAGITPIAAGLALAVIIHRSERARQSAA